VPLRRSHILSQIDRDALLQTHDSEGRRFIVSRSNFGSKESSPIFGPQLRAPMPMRTTPAATSRPAVNEENGSAASTCFPGPTCTGPSAHLSGPAGSTGKRSSWQSSTNGICRPNWTPQLRPVEAWIRAVHPLNDTAIRKYRCRSCGKVMLCSCDREHGQRFLPHQLGHGAELETKQRNEQMYLRRGFQFASVRNSVQCNGSQFATTNE
jgi:hypothetical protein